MRRGAERGREDQPNQWGALAEAAEREGLAASAGETALPAQARLEAAPPVRVEQKLWTAPQALSVRRAAQRARAAQQGLAAQGATAAAAQAWGVEEQARAE